MKDVVFSVLTLWLEFAIIAILSWISVTLFKLVNDTKKNSPLQSLTVSLIAGLIFFIVSIELPIDLHERAVDISMALSVIVVIIITLMMVSIIISFLYVREKFIKLEYIGKNTFPLHVYFIFAVFTPILTVILTMFNV